jgi:flagellar biosynthesis/type III secretory pathway protein FliH
LQQAINYGYQQGVRAGREDRSRGLRYDYQDSDVYQNGDYGYNGSDVDPDQYNYYYEEGLRRGYEDGYNSRWQYGSNSNGGINILSAILQQLLNFQAF